MRTTSIRSGRLAAWMALAAAVLVVIALGELLIRNVRTLLLVVVALAVAGAAVWIALTRRRAVRWIALVVVVLALAACIVILVRGGAVDELIVLAVALAIFSLLSRTAIRQATVHERMSQEGQAARTRPTLRKQRAVLLMNPRSGDGKPEQFHLVDEARRRGIEPILLQTGQDWSAAAREAARAADVIGMAGGDGSQALVAQIAMEHSLPYVCIPAGTRNHLALDLGLDRHDIVEALDAFSSDVETSIDLAFVNDRVFVNNVSLGIYAEIVQSDGYRAAKLETMEKMLPDLLGPRARPFDLSYFGPRGETHQSAELILVSNNPYQLDRLAGMGSRPRLDTGVLGILTLEIKNAAEAAELLSLEAVGQVLRFSGWIEWAAPTFWVNSRADVAAGIDGEAVLLSPPLRFRIVPGALQVRLPPTAGLSPAALKPGLTATGLRELWSIASRRQPE